MKYLPFLFTASFTVPSLADTVVIAQNGLDYFPREAQVEVGDTVRWEWSNGTHDVASGANCSEDGVFYGVVSRHDFEDMLLLPDYLY